MSLGCAKVTASISVGINSWVNLVERSVVVYWVGSGGVVTSG